MEGLITAIFILIYVGILVLLVVSMIFFALGLRRMSERADIKHTWLAWIPIFNYYLVGELAKDSPLIKSGKRFLAITLIGLGVTFTSIFAFQLVLDSQTPFAGVIGLFTWFILYLIFIAYLWIGHYFLLARYTKHALLLTLLSIFVSQLVLYFAVYALRDKPVLDQKDNKIQEEG